jgi:hypothetical protein
MATPPLRRRAGMIEIKEKERKAREELRKRRENEKTPEVSEEEHEKRLEMLKSIGAIK